jgi:hypothetical protein
MGFSFFGSLLPDTLQLFLNGVGPFFGSIVEGLVEVKCSIIVTLPALLLELQHLVLLCPQFLIQRSGVRHHRHGIHNPIVELLCSLLVVGELAFILHFGCIGSEIVTINGNLIDSLFKNFCRTPSRSPRSHKMSRCSFPMPFKNLARLSPLQAVPLPCDQSSHPALFSGRIHFHSDPNW